MGSGWRCWSTGVVLVLGLAGQGCSNAPLAGILDCCFPSKLQAPAVRPPLVGPSPAGPSPLGPPSGGPPADRLPPPADLTPGSRG
jgi:hypothetical protein